MKQKEEIKFILSYITKLDNDIKDYNDFNISENMLYDDIRETIAILGSELPNDIDEKLLWKNGNGVSDANICIGLLKKYLIKNGYEEEKLDIQYDNLKKMMTFLKTYIDDVTENYPYKLDSKYLEIVKYGFEDQIVGVNLDLNKEIKLNYGLDIEYDNLSINIQNINMIAELFYKFLRDKSNRYKYTIDINNAFSRFSLPYRLNCGIVQNSQIITTYNVSLNLNKDKFDDKIKRSLNLIISNDLVDKKCALNLLIDSLDYLIDMQNKKGKQRLNLCKKVNNDENSKVYAVLSNEINEIHKMANSFFDLRHNEKAQEALVDSRFIEYLYNRINSILNLFIICINK